MREVLGDVGFLGVEGLGLVLEAGLEGGTSACTGTWGFSTSFISGVSGRWGVPERSTSWRTELFFKIIQNPFFALYLYGTTVCPFPCLYNFLGSWAVDRARWAINILHRHPLGVNGMNYGALYTPCSYISNGITLVTQVVLADSAVAGRTLRTRTSMLVGRLADPVSPERDRTAESEPITERENILQARGWT